MGDYVFYNAAGNTEDPSSNRALLISLCEDLNLKIANTFFQQEMSNLATYYELASNLCMPVSSSTHAQIDFILCENRWLNQILDVWSDRSVALSSHHFILLGKLNIEITKTVKKEKRAKYDFSYLHTEINKRNFALSFSNYCRSYKHQVEEIVELNQLNTLINENFRSA